MSARFAVAVLSIPSEALRIAVDCGLPARLTTWRHDTRRGDACGGIPAGLD